MVVAMRKQTKRWTTKTGEKIRICDMSDSHLFNTINMFRRKADPLRMEMLSELSFATSILQGEMALDAVDSDLCRLGECSDDELLEDMWPIYSCLLADAERRGLQP